MPKENFQIPENQPSKTKEIFKNLVSLILPEKLTFEEQLKSLETQRLEIKNILEKKENKSVNNKNYKPEEIKKSA
jgi:hypothetical protein